MIPSKQSAYRSSSNQQNSTLHVRKLLWNNIVWLAPTKVATDDTTNTPVYVARGLHVIGDPCYLKAPAPPVRPPYLQTSGLIVDQILEQA